MWNALLPRQVDNGYRGSRVAIWLLGILLLLRTIMSVNSIVNGRSVASSADGIPLDTYAPAAARTVVSLFSLLGLANLMICVVGLLVLARYRALIPFVFSLLLLHHLGRILILRALPIERAGTSPGYFINLGLLGLTVVGLVLSLWRRRGGPVGSGAGP